MLHLLVPSLQGLATVHGVAVGTVVPARTQAAGLFSVIDPAALLSGLGPATLAVVALIVFIESGLLFPFLPGDSLLFTAGLLHQQLNLPLPVLIGVVVLAAIAGDQVGYLLGRKFGRRWFKEDARILKTKYLHETEEFFAKRGGWAIVLARFVPVVRTYAPLVAGVANYNYKKFTLWNIAGAVGWAGSIVMLGTWLGHYEIIAKNIDIIAILLVLASVIPGLFSLLHKRRAAKASVHDDDGAADPSASPSTPPSTTKSAADKQGRTGDNPTGENREHAQP